MANSRSPDVSGDIFKLVGRWTLAQHLRCWVTSDDLGSIPSSLFEVQLSFSKHPDWLQAYGSLPPICETELQLQVSHRCYVHLGSELAYELALSVSQRKKKLSSTNLKQQSECEFRSQLLCFLSSSLLIHLDRQQKKGYNQGESRMEIVVPDRSDSFPTGE